MASPSPRRASSAWRTVRANASGATTCLPASSPQRFGKVWSSIWIALTPAASNSRTVRATFTAPPKPVSASHTTGTSTACTTFAARRTISLAVVRPMSGNPRSLASLPRPVM